MVLGKDCLGCAKTGSGKTAAFALPMLQKLCEDPFGIFALILAPTRYVSLCPFSQVTNSKLILIFELVTCNSQS